MNSFIKEQLKKCKVAELPNLEQAKEVLFIPKKEPEKEPELNHYYIIELEDYVINEPEGFTLSANWNKGTKPTCSYYKVQVVQLLGKMVKVSGISYDVINSTDLSDVWTGWLPRASFHIKKELCA